MKLFLIEFDEVDYEEDFGVLVSAKSKEHAIKVAEIVKEKKDKGFGNRYESNIESIKEIGTYNKDIAEEIIVSNRGA